MLAPVGKRAFGPEVFCTYVERYSLSSDVLVPLDTLIKIAMPHYNLELLTGSSIFFSYLGISFFPFALLLLSGLSLSTLFDGELRLDRAGEDSTSKVPSVPFIGVILIS